MNNYDFYDTLLYEKKLLLLFFFITSISSAQNSYIRQIRVVDACTFLTEVLTVKSLGIKGIHFDDIEAVKSIRACKKSLKKYPSDPHVAFLLARAYTKAKQYKEGIELARSSCRAGDLGGCTLLGGYYSHGLGVSHDDKKAYLLWLWSCTQGDGHACRNLAIKVEHKDEYIPKDSKRKSDYLIEACISGMYPNACIVHASYMYSKDIPYDEDLYIYTNYKACASGHSNSCSELDDVLKNNKIPNRKAMSFQVYKESCNNKNARACRELGHIYGRMPRNRVNNLTFAPK